MLTLFDLLTLQNMDSDDIASYLAPMGWNYLDAKSDMKHIMINWQYKLKQDSKTKTARILSIWEDAHTHERMLAYSFIDEGDFQYRNYLWAMQYLQFTKLANPTQQGENAPAKEDFVDEFRYLGEVHYLDIRIKFNVGNPPGYMMILGDRHRKEE